jgi:hypothetical protein
LIDFDSLYLFRVLVKLVSFDSGADKFRILLGQEALSGKAFACSFGASASHEFFVLFVLDVLCLIVDLILFLSNLSLLFFFVLSELFKLLFLSLLLVLELSQKLFEALFTLLLLLDQRFFVNVLAH